MPAGPICPNCPEPHTSPKTLVCVFTGRQNGMIYDGQDGSKQSRYQHEQVLKLMEVGTIPQIANPERRAFCRTDLHAFLLSYFPETTGLKPFSDDQKAANLPFRKIYLNPLCQLLLISSHSCG